MRTFVEKEPIQKGWSCDSKYRVTTPEGEAYLLRITPFEKSASREQMFRMQQEAAALGVPMCCPVEMGICEEGVYMLQTWIDGQDAEDVIPGLPEDSRARTLAPAPSLPGIIMQHSEFGWGW